MTIIVDFASLVAVVADYSHRPDLTDQIEDNFIQLASVRIGRDLKSSATEQLVTLDGVALGNPLTLPSDFSQIRSINWESGPRPVSLSARDEISITAVPSQGDPFAYNIRDGAINVRPFVSSDYTLSYYGIPILNAANPTNNVLTRHPQIYLYAALVELQIWTQDAEQRALALDAYRGETEVTNRNERRARMNTTLAVGVS